MVLIIVEGSHFPIFCPEMKTSASILIYAIIEIRGSSNFMIEWASKFREYWYNGVSGQFVASGIIIDGKW